MADKWTKEWPTEPGWYWFYGRKFRNWSGDGTLRMYTVRVRRISNGMAYVVDGHFIYEAEGARGWWQSAVLPELPEEDV